MEQNPGNIKQFYIQGQSVELSMAESELQCKEEYSKEFIRNDLRRAFERDKRKVFKEKHKEHVGNINF